MTHRSLLRGALWIAASIAFPTTGLAGQQQKCPATTGETMPLKYTGGKTVPAITACDLMTRLYIYSDDSMMGRRVGTPDNIRATAYIEHEVRQLGLKPAGDSGGYFQYLPVVERRVDSASSLVVAGRTFHAFTDFTVGGNTSRSIPATKVVFGGTANDTTNILSPDAVRGSVLVLRAAAGGGGVGGLVAFGGGGRGGRGGGRGAIIVQASPAMVAYQQMTAAAAAILTVAGDQAGGGGRGGRGGGAGRGGPTGQFIDSVQTAGQAAYLAAHPAPANGRGGRGGGRGGAGGGALAATIQARVADAIFGKPLDQLAKGTEGNAVALDVKVIEHWLPTRNVVAIFPGSDPKLKNEYVAIGGHNDHNGYTIGGGIEHDSLKAYNMVALVEGADTRPRPVPTAEQWVRINFLKDSLRKIYPARIDSIQNGADDDGSGSVAVLELAQAFAKSGVKPKRSIIFVWHTGEEAGLWGSQWFTNHPTVPRDSIVAQLNIDMIGRGEATDVTGRAKAPDGSPPNTPGEELHGSPNYVQLVGARRLSTELGDIAEQVNKTEKTPLTFDYSMDANGHPQNIYCRSDHANYARYGIPVIFFTTGGHADYHQNTDEPQYIRYQHMARVDQLIFDIAMHVADLDHPVKRDQPKPESPFAACQQ